MPTTKRDLQALQYLAQRIRQETLGAGPWHDNGLTAVLSRLEGHNLAITIERVTRHAADPEAKTPAAIERPFVPDAPTPPARQPAKAGSREECRLHPGQWAPPSCGSCRADALAGDEPTPPRRDKPPAEVSQRGAAACRTALGLPEPSPAATSTPAAGEPDDRPESACLADGCFRPTTQGICDRCREQATAEDIEAANAELVERLKAGQRERAHDRPAPDPEPPRRFTSADIDHDRVRAAMGRRTTASDHQHAETEPTEEPADA